MRIEIREGTFDLQPSQLLRLRAAAGATVRCESGVLWVTQEGRSRDDFLCAGQSLVLASGGVTVVEPIGELAARIRLHVPALAQRASGALQATC